MERFRNKYRSETARLRNWNYAWAGCYYVTLCTKKRVNYFGEITDNIMILSKPGKIAQQYWMEIPYHFSCVELDEFIIMPNHIHGIITINNKNGNNNGDVETQNLASLQKIPRRLGNKFGPQSKNLSSIIRGYKAGVKKWATMNKIYFKWQPRFYDHIIRNNQSLNNIREYIINNPATWKEDKEYVAGTLTYRHIL